MVPDPEGLLAKLERDCREWIGNQPGYWRAGWTYETGDPLLSIYLGEDEEPHARIVLNRPASNTVDRGDLEGRLFRWKQELRAKGELLIEAESVAEMKMAFRHFGLT